MLYKDKIKKVSCALCHGYDSKEVHNAIIRAVSLLGAADIISPEGEVLIKPNLCLLEKPEKAITTHPQIVRQTAEWASSYNKNIVIGDSPVGDADKTRMNNIWEVSGIKEVMANMQYSRTFFETELLEFSCDVNGKACTYFMAKEISEIRTIINLPKFKTHSLMTYTGAVKNLYGLLPGNAKKKLHSLFPEKKDFATLLVQLYLQIKPSLNIIDAVVCLEGDGPGAAGCPRTLNLIMASEDALALDFTAAQIMNIDPTDVPTNKIAIEEKLLNPDLIEIVGEPLETFIQTDYKIPHTARYTPALTKKLFEISRPVIKVNEEKCTCCSLCEANCPVGCIATINGIAEIDKKACISCMTCHEICPNIAIEISEPAFYKRLKRGNYNDSK